MGLTYTEMAIKTILSEGNKPLKVSDIQKVAEKKGYTKLLNKHNSVNPVGTLSTALLISVNRNDGIFKAHGSPVEYNVTNKGIKEFDNFDKSDVKIKNGNCKKVEIDNVYRKPIPKHMKDAVWRRFWGNIMDGYCIVDGSPIQSSTFECGHIISDCDGGEIDILNLVPICGTCNKSMGSENLISFKKRVWNHVGKPAGCLLDIFGNSNSEDVTKEDVIRFLKSCLYKDENSKYFKKAVELIE